MNKPRAWSKSLEKIVEGTNKSKEYYERQAVVSHQQRASCVMGQ